MIGLPAMRDLGCSTLCGSVAQVEKKTSLSKTPSLQEMRKMAHRRSSTMIANRCDRKLRIFLLIGRICKLGIPKEKALAVSISDYDMTINEKSWVVTDSIVWSFSEVEKENDIFSDREFTFHRCR